MRVTSAHLQHFRNHSQSIAEFGPGVNALLGKNGQGKTNIIEALSFLSLTKSFYAATENTVLQIGKPRFEVAGEFIGDSGSGHKVVVQYDRDSGEKGFTVNNVKPESLSSVIGRFPVVLLSPEKSAITFGGPSERRRFLDLVLSQMNREYLISVLEYRRVLRQRNALLGNVQTSGNLEALEPWNEALARHGSRVTFRRREFISEFGAYVTAAYKNLTHGGEEPGMAYVTVAGGEEQDPVDVIEGRLRESLNERRAEEIRRRMTLVGPHRDELKLTLNGLGIQKYASQGQHKTFLVALKIAEFQYMRERLNETPMLLLDDVFSELDEERSRCLVGLASTLGQTIITATDESVFRGAIKWNGTNRKFYVENGTVRPS